MKTKNFIQRNSVAIAAFTVLAVFGIGWYATGQPATTSIGEDIVVGGNLSVGGNQVITSAGVLQNVTAAAGIITSGTFDTARIPNLDAGKITTGTFADARIPNLAATKITSGTFPAGISANAPTQNAHLATKLYVDNAVAGAGGDLVAFRVTAGNEACPSITGVTCRAKITNWGGYLQLAACSQQSTGMCFYSSR